MTISESKGRCFYKTNRFESIRITNRMESIRIANWNALVGIPQAPDLTPRRIVKLTHHAAARDWDEV